MSYMNNKSRLKILGLIWILIECSLVAGNIFGFAALFGVLPQYKIYASECTSSSIDENVTQLECSGQIAQYELAFTLGIAFYNLPAMIVGIISDFCGPRFLKFIAIIFHLISWLSLGFVAPGRDWLLHCHTIFCSLSGICTLLSSFSIAAHFTGNRGLVTALISGAQITGPIWYAIYEILISKNVTSLSRLAFIWASFAIMMFGSAILFLDWRFKSKNSKSKSQTNKKEVNETKSQDTLLQHLKNPLFIVVTLFLSCLLLTISVLPVTWFSWLVYLTNGNLPLVKRYTFMYNMSALSGLIFAPLCGFIVDFKAYQSDTQKILNISILQTFTWLSSVALCFVCMFESIHAAISALVILLVSRPVLVAGSQALVATIFPPQFIGSLLGVMWTVAGVISFLTYPLGRLAYPMQNVWKAWAIILILAIVVSGHLFQVWILYFKAKRNKQNQQPTIASDVELETMIRSNQN